MSELVGREAELKAITRFLDSCDRRRPSAIVLSGEEGIEQELACSTPPLPERRREGFEVLTSRPTPSEGGVVVCRALGSGGAHLAR